MGISGEIKGLWKGKINPILATVGSLIILAGIIKNPLFWMNALISVIILISAIMFWKYQENNVEIEE